MEARSGLFEQGAIGRSTKAKLTLPLRLLFSKLFRAGILRRFKSLADSRYRHRPFCRMLREHLIQHTSGSGLGLIRRVSVASDIYCLCRPDSLRIGHGNVTNALPPPGADNLLKRYHPHLLPGLNNMR